MASFAEVAAQTESVIPMPSSGESSADGMRTSATFHQQAATAAPTQTVFASSGVLYGDTAMQVEEGSHYIPAQPTMTTSSPGTGASGALSALAALATSAAMQRDTPMQPHHNLEHQEQLEEEEDHTHQILQISAPIAIARNTITPHQTSSDDDSEAMPPPPPRIPTTVPPLQPQPYPTNVDSDGFTSILAFHNDASSLYSSSPYNSSRRVGGRVRSVSNPEGMEKWDSYTRRNDRMHFVLPSSILEEELASTKRIIEEKKTEEDYVKGYIKKGDEFSASPFGAMAEFSPEHPFPQSRQNIDAAATTSTTAASRRSKRQHKPKSIFGTSPDSVSTDLTPPVSTSKSKKKNQSSSATAKTSSSSKSFNVENLTSNVTEEEEEEIDESLLEPEELLRRARSRLLEDLSEGSEDGVNGGGLNGEKGVLTLPHSLGKYKEVRNRVWLLKYQLTMQSKHVLIKFSSNHYLPFALSLFTGLQQKWTHRDIHSS